MHARALRPFRSFFEGQELPPETIAARLETLTGLSPSTALRRARTLVQWRRYVDGGRSGRTPTELSLPDLAPQLDRMVQHHNALAKQRLVDWLMRIDPAEFERLVGRLLTAMGYQEVEVLGGPGDGGVDVRASQLDRWSHPIRRVVQVKRHARALGRRVIDEMIGVLARHRADYGIIVTTSDFSTAARAAAAAEPRLLPRGRVVPRSTRGPVPAAARVQGGRHRAGGVTRPPPHVRDPPHDATGSRSRR